MKKFLNILLLFGAVFTLKAETILLNMPEEFFIERRDYKELKFPAVPAGKHDRHGTYF